VGAAEPLAPSRDQDPPKADGISAARAALLSLGALVLAAALADLGDIHALEHGDSLVPVLVSLQRWTPMYWDQERYGMLVPLLALPFRDPLVNLLLQRGLLVLAGLASVVLLACFALPRRIGLLAGLLSAGSLLLLMPAPWLFEFLGDQPYGLSLALVLAGLLVADAREGRRGRARLGLAVVLCLLGHWVNATAGLFLAPVALARAAAERFTMGEPPLPHGLRRQLVVDLGLLGLGVAAGWASIQLYPIVTGYPLRLDVGSWPVSAWPGLLGTLLRRGLAGAGPAWPIAAGCAAVAGLALPWPPAAGQAPSSPRRRAALRALALVAAALAYALWTATLHWVSANEFHWRYLAPSLVLAHLAALSLLCEPISRLRPAARPALAAALLLVPLGAAVAYGPPSLSRVEAELDARLGTWTEDVLSARCDLVAGDYWSVWPAVWHAGWVAYGRGSPAPYGITHRTNATARFWKGRPAGELRICRIRGKEEQSEYWLRAFHLWPVRALEERKTVEVVVPNAP
jgi:hypothetical protein